MLLLTQGSRLTIFVAPTFSTLCIFGSYDVSQTCIGITFSCFLLIHMYRDYVPKVEGN